MTELNESQNQNPPPCNPAPHSPAFDDGVGGEGEGWDLVVNEVTSQLHDLEEDQAPGCK